MPAGTDPAGPIADTALKQLASSPPVAVALFFMWLCGIVLSFVFVENNAAFSKEPKQSSWFFNLALGFLPGSIVMLVYHGIVHRELISTLSHLNDSALPSSLILAGLTCIAFLIKARTP